MYAVLAGLICTSNKWANYRSWQFSKSFHCSLHVMLWHLVYGPRCI